MCFKAVQWRDGTCRGKVDHRGTERGKGAVNGSVEQGARGKERKRLGRRERATGWCRERKGWSRWH
jgi:hypothetical protein